MKYSIGLDMGGTTTKIGLFTAEGQMLEEAEIPTRSAMGRETLFQDMADAVTALCGKCGIPLAECCVGMGVAGPVEENGYVERLVNLNQYDLYPGHELSQRLNGIPVAVSNDANVAALGEMWQGGGKGSSNMVLVTLGTGVGGGVIVEGKLLTGIHGSGGEIGHLKINPDESTACGCGKHGCLEQYVSATGIVNQAKRFLADCDTPSAMRNLNPLTAKDVMDLAKNGDAVALRVAEAFGEILGRALAIVSCVCDPEVFVLGGGVSKAGTYLIDLVQPSFVKHAFPATEPTRFGLAILGNDAGIYGAAKLILDSKM